MNQKIRIVSIQKLQDHVDGQDVLVDIGIKFSSHDVLIRSYGNPGIDIRVAENLARVIRENRKPEKYA